MNDEKNIYRIIKCDVPDRIFIKEDLSIIKVNSFVEVLPYLNSILELLNNNFPPVQDRVQFSELIEEIRFLENKGLVNIARQWQGTSFILAKGDSVVGVIISRRESFFNSSNGDSVDTGRAFVPFLAINSAFRGRYTSLMIACAIKALISFSCREFFATTAIGNSKADLLYSKISTARAEEGRWIRFSFTPASCKMIIEKVNKIEIFKKVLEYFFN
ncbi:MAG: hypothetical protein PHO56_00565 [Patescibacteria group bacterium]|nr:hypothetical protein [Patescibacteria group bacterium]